MFLSIPNLRNASLPVRVAAIMFLVSLDHQGQRKFSKSGRGLSAEPGTRSWVPNSDEARVSVPHSFQHPVDNYRLNV